jgi:hypothetical protein
LESALIRSNVLHDKGDAVLRKKLFLSVTCPSPGLGVDHHLLCHRILRSWTVELSHCA